MEIKKGKMLIEGSSKKLYATGVEGQLLLHFKDDAPNILNSKETAVKNKGSLNCSVTETLMQFLKSYHVHTHFLNSVKPNEMLVRQLDMIPLKVMTWNVAAGDLCRRFQLEKGKILNYPIVEYYLKSSKLDHPMVNMDHLYSLGYASPEEMRKLDQNARKVNAVLKSFFERRRLNLVMFFLEFGRLEGQMIIGDEISLDSCLLWDLEVSPSKSDRFFKKSETLSQDYEELKDRICG